MSTQVATQSTVVRKVVVAGVLGAVAILLGATHLGYIPWVVGVAITVMHVPVIIGAILEGPIVGAAIGLLFGLSSMVQAYVAPTGPGDYYFRNPIVSVLPRLLIGPLAYLVYRLLQERKSWKSLGILMGVIAVALGALAVAYATPTLPSYETALGVQAGAAVPTLKVIVLASTLLIAVLGMASLYWILRHKSEATAVGTAAVVGTLTNTILVLGTIGLMGSLGWAAPLPWVVILAVAVTNGIPEIVAAVILTVAVVVAWKRIETGRRKSRI